MSLMEWFGESIDPGDIGSMEMGSRDRHGRSRISVIFCSTIALTLLGLWIYFLYFQLELGSAKAHWIAAGITIGYLLIAYFVHPQPDLDNIGWFGGLFDHPFRYSDDFNRTLIFLLIILYPGRFISESIVDLIVLVCHAGQSSSSNDEYEYYDNEEETDRRFTIEEPERRKLSRRKWKDPPPKKRRKGR